MKCRLTNRMYLVSILTFLCGSLLAQVPEGGIMLNDTSGFKYNKIGKGSSAVIQITDQPFTKALQVTIGNDIENAWDAQVQFPAVNGIADGDVIFVAFYARTISSGEETGEGALNVIVENNTTYAKDLSSKIVIGNEWKEYYASAVCVSTLSTSQITYTFHMGFPDQTIEIADVRYINYKNQYTLEELPVTLITYHGQDPEAAWRAPAEERINQIRKGTGTVTVYDEFGQPLENVSVKVEMIQHQFGFGSAIPGQVFISNATFRNKVYELFNEVVFENDLKWGPFNPNNTSTLRRAFDSLEAHNIEVRGHNVIWPAWRWIPSSIKLLEKDPVALQAAIEKRIDDVTLFTKGKVNDWDVINEPYTEHDIMDILGNEIMAEWFKQVRRNDPQAKLYLNDYSIISAGGTNTKKQDFYYNLVKYMDDLGAQIDGIGFQGHMSSDLTSITKVYSIIDRFAELGKDIKITEHDINMNQRGVQADYTRDFMTILFSHPSVKSMLFWGFWENSHWRPDAALYDADWTIRPHGEMYKEMVFNQWWTKETEVTTDANGEASFEGFLGTYKYTITQGENVRTGTFELGNSHQSGLENVIVFSFDENIPDNVSISSDQPPFLCEGENVTLSLPEINSADYIWYKNGEQIAGDTAEIVVFEPGKYSAKITSGQVEIIPDTLEVFVYANPEAVISYSGELSFCDGNSVELTANASDGLIYKWMNETTTLPAKGTSINATKDGTHVLITMNAYGCTSSDTVEIDVFPVPEANIIVDGQLTFCEGDSVNLSINPAPEVTYTWMLGDTPLQNPGNTFYVKETGNYSLVASNAFGCIINSDTTKVVVLSSNDTECNVSSVRNELNSVLLYPNPCEGYFTIESTLFKDQAIQVDLYNATGKLVFTKKYERHTSNQIRIPVPDKGLFTAVVSQGREIQTFKVVSK